MMRENCRMPFLKGRLAVKVGPEGLSIKSAKKFRCADVRNFIFTGESPA
jgi:hypothetical protein